MQATTTVRAPPSPVAADAPWVEKYRPATLADVKGQAGVIHLFQQMLATNKPMHFLFYGPPGTGKTSTILSLCKELYKDRPRSQYVLEINASNDRGIDMVRQKIKPFCKRSTTPFVSATHGHTVDYKFVILDEADTLTTDAQNALRRCIEIYSYNTRFCFLCNYVSNVLPPILSRCYACHFKPVERTDALALMASICAAEGVPHTPDVLTTAYDTLRGDLRACLTTIQAVYHMHRRVSVALLEEQLGSVAADVWDTVCACKSAKDVRVLVDHLHREGQSVRRLLQALVAWSLSNCPADQVRALGPMASRMERQALFQTDARLLLHELVLTVWLVCGQGVTVSRGGST